MGQECLWGVEGLGTESTDRVKTQLVVLNPTHKMRAFFLLFQVINIVVKQKHKTSDVF